MKSIFKRFSAGATGKAGEKARERGKKPPVRRRHIVRG
jgi:hypothetical protein